MKAYRYILPDYRDRPRPKYQECPACGEKQFIPYFDTLTNENVEGDFGKCERNVECGFHAYPGKLPTDKPATEPAPPDRIDAAIVADTLKAIERNSLYVALTGRPGFADAKLRRAFEKYRVGTAKGGACVFWLHDFAQICRSGKVMQYDQTAHRTHKPTWAHSMLKIEDFKLKPVLFGEHLLATDAKSTIALVESEKTALIMSILGIIKDDNYQPYIWLATCGKQNFTEGAKKRLWSLFKRKVDVYPDIDGFGAWGAALGPLREDLKFEGRVIDWPGLFDAEVTYLLRNPDKADIADYMIATFEIRAKLARLLNNVPKKSAD